MAESALAVPKSGFGGVDAYPEFVQKAALLASRLARDHPLPDGNKRVAWLAMIEFIERNGFNFEQPDVDDAVWTMFALAAGEIPELDFVEWLRPFIQAPFPPTE
jgi:death on curing protein